MSATIIAINVVGCSEKARAKVVDRYPISSATSRMRSAVRKLTRPGLASARDTVEGATPAIRATS